MTVIAAVQGVPNTASNTAAISASPPAPPDSRGTFVPARVLCSKLLLYRSGQPDEPRSSSSQTAAGLTAIPPATHQPDNHRDQIQSAPFAHPAHHPSTRGGIDTNQPLLFHPRHPVCNAETGFRGAGWLASGWLADSPPLHARSRQRVPPGPAGSPARRVSHRPASLLIGHQQGVKWMRLGLVSPRYVQCGRGAYVRSFGPRCVALSRHRTRHDDDGPSARGHGGS